MTPPRAKPNTSRGTSNREMGRALGSPPVRPHLLGEPESNARVRPLGAVHSFAITILANALLAGVGALTGILLARLLGPTGRGELAAIQIWPMFLAGLALAGMPEALIYLCSKRPKEVREHLATALCISLGFSILLVTIGYFVIPIALENHASSTITASQAYLALIPAYVLIMLPAETLRGQGAFVRWNILRAVPPVVWLIVLLFAWLFTVTRPSELANAYVLGLLFASVPMMVVVIRWQSGRLRPKRHLWRALLSFGLPAVGAQFPLFLNLRLDQLVMASFVPPHQLGLYVAGVAWAGVMAPVMTAFGYLMLPRLARENDPHHVGQLFAQASRLAGLLAFVTGIPALIITPFAISILFGSSFRAAIPSAVVLVVAGALLGVNYVLGEALLGIGRTRAPLYSQLVGVAITGVGLALLLRPLGILGAAVTSAIGYGATTLVLLWLGKQATGIGLGGLIVPHRADLYLIGRSVRDAARVKPRRPVDSSSQADS